MVEMADKPEIEQQIKDAVRRLSSDFNLSEMAQRLVQLYFEVLCFERNRDQTENQLQPDNIERFMRKVADALFRPENEGLPPDLSTDILKRYYRLKPRSSDGMQITAAELLRAFLFLGDLKRFDREKWPLPFIFFYDEPFRNSPLGRLFLKDLDLALVFDLCLDTE